MDIHRKKTFETVMTHELQQQRYYVQAGTPELNMANRDDVCRDTPPCI
jgi:hypothetical protein